MGNINDDMPRKESYEFFEKVTGNHDKVGNLEKESQQIYIITRKKGDKIKLYLTNLYTIGLTEYYDIKDKYYDINAILTISNWNGYTTQAKEEAKKSNVGIFVAEEFMGALNWDDYVNYTKRDHEGEIINFGARSS